MSVIELVERFRADIKQSVGDFGYKGVERDGSLILITAERQYRARISSSEDNIIPGLTIDPLEEA